MGQVLRLAATGLALMVSLGAGPAFAASSLVTNPTAPEARATTTADQYLRAYHPTALPALGPPVAQNVTAPPMLNSNGATAIPPLIATEPAGTATIASYLLTNLPTTEGVLSYTRSGSTVALNALSTVAQRTLTPTEITTLNFDPTALYVGKATFNYLATDTGGLNSNTATYTLPVGAATTVTGTIFDDIDYGGGLGRTLATATSSANGSGYTIGRTGATVELYDDQNNFIATTTSAANGLYTFANVPGITGGQGYKVRVVNATVTAARNTGNVASILGVQTLAYTNTNRVGGEVPALADAPARAAGQTLSNLTTTTATAQSQAPISVTTTGLTGVDFGFNFDVVVNTNNAGLGSLLQFMTNANALVNTGLDQAAASTGGADPAAGVETSIFMVADGLAHGGLRAGLPNLLSASGVVVISPPATTVATALPVITDPGTSLDGTTQTQNVGNTNNVTLGTGGFVGSAGTTVLAQLNGPEVQIVGTPLAASSNFGLNIQANNTTVRGLAIYGFGNAQGNTFGANIQITSATTAAITGTLITGNVVGTSATAFVDPGVATRSTGNGVYITAGSAAVAAVFGVIVSNNLVGYNGTGGVENLVPGTSNGTTTGIIENGNEIRGNALLNSSSDGTRTGISGSYIINSLIQGNQGPGIDFVGTTGNITVSNNTISNNGLNGTGQTSGLRLFGAGNNISLNIISSNYGAGILTRPGTSTSIFTQNAIFANGTILSGSGAAATGEIGIDLEATGDDENKGTAPFVTINDDGDADGTTAGSGANTLFNFPVIQSATFRNGRLLLAGYVTAGAVVEVFVSDNLTAATPGFGQGKTYLGSFTEGSTADTDATTGTYGPATVNGLAQGTETNQQRFAFAIPLASLTTAQLSALNAPNARLTSTATLATLGTSEFSGTATALNSPTANNDFVAASANPAAPVTFAVTANDTPTGAIDPATIDLDPNTTGIQTSFTTPQGTFTTVGVTAGSVKFTPATLTFTGNVILPYVVNNTEGVPSNQANLTVTVNPVLDLITAITAPAANGSVTAGGALSYTVAAKNNSAVAASSVTQTLQLVPGLTSNGGAVSFTLNGTASTVPTYDNVSGLVSFTPTAITLAANTTNTYGASFTKAPAGGSITATASIGTAAGANGPETDRTNNADTQTVNITPSYDVATTFSGPVDNTGAAVPVVAGTLVSYVVRTTDLSTAASPAPGVIQTVTFDGNLLTADGTSTGIPTGLYISNGGTATYNSTTNKTVVTFPTLTTLSIGQTLTNTISFAAPSLAANATYGATANVQANGAATPGAVNPNDTGTTNNAASVTTTIKAATGTTANVYTTISSNATVTTAGSTVTLTVVAGNKGTGTATNVVQQVMLPPALTGPGTGGTVVVTNGTYDPATGIVTFSTTASLTPQAVNPLPFTIQFNAPATGPVLAAASVRQDNADAVPGDNVAAVKVDVNGITDVTTTLTGPASAAVGQSVTYAITTANNGPAPAYGVVQTVLLPAGLTATGGVTFAGPTGGSYNNTTGVATFTLADQLLTGTRQVNSLTFIVPATAITDPAGLVTGSNQLSLVAGVRTSTSESSGANNSAVLATAVTPAADVTVNVSGPATTLLGSPVTFAVTTTNTGPVPVASIVTTLQLPAGLNAGTVLLNGAAAGTSYDNTTGLLTFSTATNLPTGSSVANTVTVVMPDVTQLTPVARAQVGGATIDSNLDNNRMAVTTTATTTTVVGSADLATTIGIQGGTTTAIPGTSVTLNSTFSNAAGGLAASNVVVRVQLPAGLTNGGNTVTVAGGTNGSYDNTTGLVSWDVVPTLAAGTTLTGYNTTFKAPASGVVLASSYVSSATADAAAGNNARSTTLTVTAQVDATTSISGPTMVQPGSRVTYAIVTVNNGPSPSGVVTQTVTIPATALNISFPAGSTQAPASGGTIVITFPLLSAQSVTPAGDVVNYVAFDAPTANYTVSATASTPNDTNTGNNTVATPFATSVNKTPLVYDVVNTLANPLAGPMGSTAGIQQILSLVATDADAGQTLTYLLTSLPNDVASSGILYLNAAGTMPVAKNVAYTAAQIANLYFDPRGTILPTDPTFVGNAFFTYTTTDNLGAVSAPALYTIPVGKDEVSSFVATTVKGGATPYQLNDPVVNLLDGNTAKYNADNSLPFGKFLANRNANTNAANTGFLSVTQTGGTLPAGVSLDPASGQFYVSDLTLLKKAAGTYSVTVTTIDLNGGTNSLVVPITIGNQPLPVELVAFEAKAVKNADAQLLWRTASEKNSAYFDVERSLTGMNFVKIGQVKGQGSTPTPTDYALTDAGIGPKANGLVYYRLKQVDLDGTSAYSLVRTVAFTTAATPGISLFPNPATSTTQLDLSQLPAGTYQVNVLDATGRAVLRAVHEAGLSYGLELNTLANGTYTVMVRGQNNGQAVNITRRLIKE